MAQAPLSTAPTQAEQNELDDALDDTFPASDPPSMTDPTHGVKVAPAAPDEQAIRERAYAIWQNAGGSHGSHDDHWAQARRELGADADGADPSDETPRTPSTAEEVR